jgi:hypothetical protein
MNKSWLLSVALLSNATLTATQPDELIAEQIALAEQLQQDLTPTIEQPKELPTDAHSPSRSDPTLLEFEKQQKILRQEIVNLFDSFIPNFLEKKIRSF